MMGKIKNNPDTYVRRGDISPGSSKKLNGKHREEDTGQAKRLAKQLTSSAACYIKF